MMPRQYVKCNVNSHMQIYVQGTYRSDICQLMRTSDGGCKFSFQHLEFVWIPVRIEDIAQDRSMLKSNMAPATSPRPPMQTRYGYFGKVPYPTHGTMESYACWKGLEGNCVGMF